MCVEDLVQKKEGTKCSDLIKEFKKWLTFMMLQKET